MTQSHCLLVTPPLFFLRLSNLGTMACLAIGHSYTDGDNFQSPDTGSPDTDTLFNTAPWRASSPTCSTGHNHTLTTAMRQASSLSLHLDFALTTDEQASLPLCQKATHKKKRVTTIQRHFHKQVLESLTTSRVDRAVLPSQSTSHTGTRLLHPSSEAYEAEDRCFRVTVARRLMMPHPAASNAADVAQTCSNKSAAGQI